MKKNLLLAAFLVINHFANSQAISEYPPYLPDNFVGIPLNSGRCHSIAVHPANSNIIITSHQFGGLWKTTDGGNNWYHLNGLNTVFTTDVCFGPDGNTVICTRSRDNAVDNGGGIWVSRNGGETWSRPATGRIPSFTRRTPLRGVANGISYDPDSIGKIFVGTSSGIAMSSDNGATWRHAMLENRSAVNWQDSLQNQVLSVVAYGGNIAFALTRTGVYKTIDGGISWTNIRAGDFTFGGSFKLIDVWKNLDARGSSFGVFIVQDFETLLLYEGFYDRWTTIPLPGGQSRWPFVRVSRAATSGYHSIWVGGGVELFKITKSRLSNFRPGLIAASDWLHLHRAEGIHDDSGFMGLDGNDNIALYGSDGGLFKPLNPQGTRWNNACIRGSGMNSYQITDIGITNYSGSFIGIRLPETSALYFATQDNGLWASGDRGINWPNSDCAEGFHIEVKKDAEYFGTPLQVAYGKVGCGPSGNMFSGPLFTSQRMVPTASTTGVALADSVLAQAFLIGEQSYFRLHFPVGGDLEGLVSINNGSNWHKRYIYNGIRPWGVVHTGRVGATGPHKFWMPFFIPGVTNRDGSDKIGLVLHNFPFRTGVATMNSGTIKYLPDNGSLGVRATEFDWQAVFGVNPDDYRHIIAPDAVNGVVKVTRDGGTTWTTDNALTNLVTRNGTIKFYDGMPNIQITHINWDPYHINRILVGTRDCGVILSEDGGNTWRRIRNSPNMLFPTGFVFQPDNIAYVSTYGRGIWKIDFNVFVSSPTEYYACRACTIFDMSLAQISVADFSSYTVIEVRGGQITGTGFSNNKKPELYISEKAFYKIRIPEKSDDNMLPSIIRGEKLPNSSFAKLKEACKDCAVTGILMKGNQIAGYIVHKEEMPLEKDDYVNTKINQEKEITETNLPEEGVGFTENQPNLSIESNNYVNGLPVVRKGSKLVLRLGNSKDIQFASGVITLNGEILLQVDSKKWKADKNGYSITLDMPANISPGLQSISFASGNQKPLTTSFLLSHIDEFEKNSQKNKKIIPVQEIIND